MKPKKIIHSQRMAGYLMLKGFVLLEIKANLKDKGRNIYLFNESDELNNALDKYNEFFMRNKQEIIREI